MKVKFLAASVLAAALLAVGVPVGAHAADAATPAKTKIMFAGDSITEGVDGDYTYRYRMAMEFKRQGLLNTVDFVGPRIWPAHGTYRHYLAAGWDTNHFGIGGTMLSEQVDNIAAVVQKYRPDILVSYLGTNDFLDVSRSNPKFTQAELIPLYKNRIDEVIANWEKYRDNVWGVDPEVKIVLGELVTPRVPVEIRNEYNARLAELVDSQIRPNRLELAQLDGSVWSSSRYLYDTIHPTPTGESLLAQRFADAMLQDTPKLFRTAPQIQRAYIPWDPPLKPAIKVKGKKIVVNWAFTAGDNSVRAMRFKFTSPKVEASSTKKARAATTKVSDFRELGLVKGWTSGKLKPGVYKIRLQGQRMYMNSTWSKTYKVRVK